MDLMHEAESSQLCKDGLLLLGQYLFNGTAFLQQRVGATYFGCKRMNTAKCQVEQHAGPCKVGRATHLLHHAV